MSDSLCSLIKSRLSIRQAAALLGIELPPKDCVKFRSPFRSDRSPSCTVRKDVFTDWSTGEHLDQIDFFAVAKGIPVAEAVKGLADILRIVGDRPARTVRQARPTADADAAERARKRFAWSEFEIPSRGEIRQIAEIRGLSPESIGLAVSRGLLWICDSREGRAWVATDSARRNAQARRLDGRPWDKIGAKAWTMPGSEASWPVGLREAANFPTIALCEGGPDMLAALHLAWIAGAEDKIAAVAMLGAAIRIPGDAIPLFAGRRVRIFGHRDIAGQDATDRWASLLARAGCAVDGFMFNGLLKADGAPVADLNDFAHLDPDQWEGERDRIESAFNFAAPPATGTTNRHQ
ncbi:MAG: hypothetical protein NTV93_06030 [Verrucomicrobia bacterium]|nr:hypothetical protein [Verrucomicrobiota bacterium]